MRTAEWGSGGQLVCSTRAFSKVYVENDDIRRTVERKDGCAQLRL